VLFRSRTLLGSFLFRGDDVFKSVAVLSGGEKSRLALLMLLLRPANLLILDEPTNHLDIASKDVLLAALKAFTGTVIFVSHDRHFISNLATAVLEVKDGTARYLPGEYEYYLGKAAEASAAEQDEAGSAPEARAASATQVQRLEDKKIKSELRALEREEGEVMQVIEGLENRRKDIEHSMAQPEVYANGERMRELVRQHEENLAEHQRASERWEELDAKMAALKERTLRPDKASR
jgi:ATP-binding cassette subfamily F protein 3